MLNLIEKTPNYLSWVLFFKKKEIDVHKNRKQVFTKVANTYNYLLWRRNIYNIL